MKIRFRLHFANPNEATEGEMPVEGASEATEQPIPAQAPAATEEDLS